MNEMLLDFAGVMPVPVGYQVIDSEVAFLQHSIEDGPLMVRGAHLCQWAAEFWSGRNVAYRELLPPTQLLRELVPGLSEDAAQDICEMLSDDLLAKLGKLSLTELLQSLFPNSLWQTRPSKGHAADWLLWLYECAPDIVFEPLLAEQSRVWQRQVDDATFNVYAATNARSASKLLDIWLGLTPDPLLSELGLFPRELPNQLHSHATRVWKNEIIARRGALLSELEGLPILPELMRLVARETVNYLEHHPVNLTTTLRDQLTPYLVTREQNRLLNLMPPPLPGDLPAEPAAILTWFRDQYLPARQWQADYGTDSDKAKINEAAGQFARWYLAHYPPALTGSPLNSYLSFTRAAAVKQSASHITLLIVMDGLHSLDANQLLRELQTKSERLTVWENGLAFAPLPTVTEVCKPALFAGVAPELADHVPTLGIIVPENSSPIDRLSRALPGEVYLWRILEPDRTYHRQNSSATLPHDVEGRLFSIAGKIDEIVKSVPAELPLRLVLTSDHGRLLAKARRKLDVPIGMQSQGRAALGALERDFDESGFIIENGVVYLHAGRFGLPYEAAVALGEDTFRTNDGKTGSEWYPHGGLYPEEVIVPWIELVRDMALPELTVKLSGSGQSGQRGELTLQLRNSGEVPVTANELMLSFSGRQWTQPINITVHPLAEESHTLLWTPWPSKAETERMIAELNLQLPNNLTFVVRIKDIQLEVIEMYQREDILGDLDL